MQRSGVWLFLLLFSVPAWGKPAHIVWYGLTDVKAYQLEVASDPRFQSVLKRTQLQRPTESLDLPEVIPGKTFARIRAVYDGKPPSDWYPLTAVRWKPVKMEKRITFGKGDAGSKNIEWEPPENSEGKSLLYRVRIQDYRTGTPYLDHYVEKTKIPSPKLPGGDFVVSVEPLGVPLMGTITSEGVLSTALLETEAVDFDPAREKELEGPPDLKRITNYFFPGFTLDSNLSFRGGDYSTTLYLEERIRFTLKSGTRFMAQVPLVIIQGGDITTDEFPAPSAPRIGGRPFPQFSISQKLFGDERGFLGLGVHFEFALDTAGASELEQHKLQGLLVFRIAPGTFIIDGNGSFGIGLPDAAKVYPFPGSFFFTDPLRVHMVGTANLLFSYEIKPEIRVGASFGWIGMGARVAERLGAPYLVDAPHHTGSFTPFFQYQFTPHLYAEARFSVLVGRSPFNGPVSNFIPSAGVSFAF